MTDEDSGLYVVNVADPEDPLIVGSCAVPGACVTVSGNYVYLCEALESPGLYVVDVANPLNPRQAGYYGLPAYFTAAAGNYAFVTSFDSALVGRLYVIEFYGGGVEDGQKPAASRLVPAATVVSGTLRVPEPPLGSTGEPGSHARLALVDAAGRRVLDLRYGQNDVRVLSPGVYFIQAADPARSLSGAQKVVIQR